MKKLILGTLSIGILFTNLSFGYQLTSNDENLIIQTTNKIEDYLSKKISNYRNNLIKQFTEFETKYQNNKRVSQLLTQVKNNIKDTSKIKIQNKIINELNKDGIVDFEFLNNTGTLNNMPFVFDKLLQEKLIRFEKLTNTSLEKITFKELNEFNQDDRAHLLLAIVRHLNSTNTTPLTSKLVDEFQNKYTTYTNITQYSNEYYQIYKKLYNSKNLTTDQKRVLQLGIEKFERNGIKLDQNKLSKLKEINQEIIKLGFTFNQNLIKDRYKISYYITGLETIKEIPSDILKTAQKAAQDQGRDGGYLFEYSNAGYLISYSTESNVRKNVRTMYKQLNTTGSFDNRVIALNILKLREQMAQILGYKNYGEYSLASKMAPSVEYVMDQEQQILAKAKLKWEKELEELKNTYGLTGLTAWDHSYYQRLLEEQKYNLDQNELRDYFEYNNVLNGLMDTINKLFDIQLKPMNIKLYSEEIKAYEVYKDSKLRGYIILDPYYKETKNSGAWADLLRNKKNTNSSNRLPILMIVTNIVKGDNVTLLDTYEVKTLYHEFGHALHGVMSESDQPELNGFFVERDFVELPSQFMENWGKGAALKNFAKHYKTGKPISDDLIEKINKSYKFSSGLETIIQILYSTIDMKLHTIKVPETVNELDQIVFEIVNNTYVFVNDPTNRIYNTFSHIFDYDPAAGDYSAGYYSYLWSEIIESDMFGKFEIKGLFDKATAQDYYNKVLSQGTRKPGLELYKDFMGRDINLDGLYEKKGFTE